MQVKEIILELDPDYGKCFICDRYFPKEDLAYWLDPKTQTKMCKECLNGEKTYAIRGDHQRIRS